MSDSCSPSSPFGQTMGQIPHSRGALALAVVGHVIGALLLVKLLDVQRAVIVPPLIVEILQPEPEIKKEEPPPKKKLPEPKVEKPLPEPDVPPEPLPQADIPPPPVVPPMQQVRREPVPEQMHPEPVPMPVPVVRRPAEPAQPPPDLAPPKDPLRPLPPPPILTAKAPTPVPVQTVVEPPRAIEKPIQAPEAPRVAPREPPRRPVPDAAPTMEIAEAPLPPDADSDAVEPPPIALPQPTGPAPEGPDIGLNAQMLTALYLRNPKPGYPAASRRLGEQGTVYLRVFVTVAGEAKRVDLKTTSGYPRLDRVALETVKTWKFVPAKREEKSIDAWVLVPIKFSLNK